MDSGMNIQLFKDVQAEVLLMLDIPHPNLVKMLFVLDSPLSIGMEFMNYGTLFDYLQSPYYPASTPWQQILTIALEVAKLTLYSIFLFPISTLILDMQRNGIFTSTTNRPSRSQEPKHPPQ